MYRNSFGLLISIYFDLYFNIDLTVELSILKFVGVISD